MKNQSNDSLNQQSEPESPLARADRELKAHWRASGLTVTERAPSDTNEFVVTFPRVRAPSAAPQDKALTTLQLEPAGLDDACQILVRSKAVLALLKESFDAVEYDEVVGLMKAGKLEGDLSGELENLLEDEIGNNSDEAWSGIIRQPHDDYGIGVYEYQGVFWVKAAEYDRVAYFLDKESAIAYAKSHWEVSEEGDGIEEDEYE